MTILEESIVRLQNERTQQQDKINQLEVIAEEHKQLKAQLERIKDRFHYVDISLLLSPDELLREQVGDAAEKLADAIYDEPEGTCSARHEKAANMARESAARLMEAVAPKPHPTSSGGEG